MKRRNAKIVEFTDTNHMTQPNLAMSIGKIVNRLQSGQSVPNSEMPIYLGDTLPEIIGFENLTKLEQIDFARAYRAKAQKEYDEAEITARELNAKTAAEKAALAILQKQQQSVNPL